jgi:hypothetical protein
MRRVRPGWLRTAGVLLWAGALVPLLACEAATSSSPQGVDITDPSAPPQAPPSGGVEYPSEAVAFIAGPQLRSGNAANPWPWFDRNARAKGLEHGAAFPATPTNSDDYMLDNYYDQGLVQYINYYRTGDARFRDYARKIADSWWRSRWIANGDGDVEDLAPRQASLGGLMLRALDGRPEMWPWITAYARAHYDIWLGLRLQSRVLHYGIRDGGYALTYVAWLARAHPDAAVRTEMREKGLRAARDYFARLQYPDGSWRWTEDPAETSTPFEQPFMVGMLMEGLIAVHLLTDDPTVRQAILRGVDHVYARGYRTDSFSAYGGGKYRGMWYFVFGPRCNPPAPGPCGEGEPMDYEDKIREVRQLNPLTLHAFGYAYKITGDAKYRTQGDEIFAATFGKGEGPGADRWYGLADFRPREYNQSYRTAGRYLAWRAGH